MLGHGRSRHPRLCPVAVLTRRLLHLHCVGVTLTNPIKASRTTAAARRHCVLPANITAVVLRRAVALLPPTLTGFAACDISARSTRAGGAMVTLCDGINSDRIRLVGRWHLLGDVPFSARPSSTSDGGCRRHYTPRLQLPPQLPTFFHRPHWWPTLSFSTLAQLADEVPTPAHE
jgi:hypothetical protein